MRLCEFWGGSVTKGLRNTGLHLYVTCLTQEHQVTDLEADVRDAAAMVTPGLAEDEDQGIIKSALRRAMRLTLPWTADALLGRDDRRSAERLRG